MIPFSLVENSRDLDSLASKLNEQFSSVAMDFEEESNLHVYGEHLCLIQLFDGENYYVIDTVKILSEKDGASSVKNFLESPIEKIMFDCSSDSAIVRKTLGVQLNNIFDVRVIAKALDFMGNLTGLIERNLGIISENPELKKKYQKTNWMKRPLSNEQIEYALGDVTYLFALKDSLIKEASSLPSSVRGKIKSDMRCCAVAKHKDKPGWEKICNFKKLSKTEKVYLRHFFIARDLIARKANMPPTNILEKQILVDMAKAGTWNGFLDENKIRYSRVFEQARLKALQEL